MDKLKSLKKMFRDMGSAVVAYSGGLDSTFLLRVASEALPGKVLAVTAVSSTYPPEELDFSRRMSQTLGVRHKVINTEELKDRRFVSNTENRCYFCKKELFARLSDIARKNKLKFVCDASNVSDNADYRPGNKAKEEFGIRSPLKEAGFTKEDIRRISRKLGLHSWNKPSLACLASRIPYGVKITPRLLSRIHKAERFLTTLGFKQVRLRHYNGLCRIEVFDKEIPKLLRKRDLIVGRLKELGYNYVTVDLEGYRTGSMNEVLRRG
ncbi:MAG: ATP-dependent sacrificial sulfur transferase LarE [Candidatus Omnitrophica bacterium]|nr:ATP-dependent sacrificial sulfur transferase LarE [Candidatus Omnitrophota bacterium]